MSNLAPAPENVILGASVPANANANAVHNPTFSQAPTVAPSRSGSDDENNKPTRGGDAIVDMNEKTGTHESDSSSDTQNAGEGPIDVEKSKAQFAQLSRQMSEASSLHRARTRQSMASSGRDVEKQEEEEEFDLLQTVRLICCH